MHAQADGVATNGVPSPVPGAERLFELDLVRGVALLGILIMNMPGFATSFYSGMSGWDQWPDWWDEGTAAARNALFSGKFNSMFSLLFGIGFTIQLERLIAKRGAAGLGIYLRRLAALFAFGAIHMLVFWTGDVLHMYALLGVLLILVRNRSDLTIWILTALSLSFPIMLGIFKMKTVDDAYFLHMERAFSAWLTTNNYAYGSGSFFEAMREHIRETWFLYTDVISLEFTASFYAQLTTTLLLGFLIGRHRIPQRLGELMPSIVRVQYWSLWIGIGSLLALTYGEKHVSPIDLTWKGIAVGMAYVICRLSVMLFYVTTLVRMVQQPRWRTRFEPIASVGRMPLTNYLLQTAIATPIFYGWGLGFWNRGGPLVWLLLALAVFFIVQVPVSVWWLKRFQFGPLEYLWRVLTYGRTMPEHLRRA
jgi:uncharacterized protein